MGAGVVRDTVTVEVDAGGRVRVNGQLAAEVVLGQVAGRDELEHQLSLHRIAGHVLRVLGEVDLATSKLSDARADQFGRGLADGLRGRSEPHPMVPDGGGPGVPRVLADRDFREGWDAGRSLAALRVHLASQLAEPDDAKAG